MNKSSQLLIELPSMLSHIVTKRGRVLRDGGSSGVSTLLKEKSKAWVATSVAATTKKQPWDEAHEVAAKLKKEFGSAVYVEPDGTAGRFQELTSPGTSLDFDSKEGLILLPGGLSVNSNSDRAKTRTLAGSPGW